MADTLQYVNWHLEFVCPFRAGQASDAFGPAWRGTWKLRAINDAHAGGDVFGDICVTSVAYYKGEKSPHGGFRISDAVAPAGDLAAARRLCGGCPANTNLAADDMAGCCGSLPWNPDDAELDASVRAAIASHGLGAAFARSFHRTEPLWYGLWIDAPLTHDQLEILRTILPDHAACGDDVARFRRACELAIRHGLALHAALPPPGHTDFGIVTTFPHCPRCRKGSGERWEQPYSGRKTTCRACGHVYVPAETARHEDDDLDDGRLERLLPPDEYQALRAEWSRRHAADTPSRLELLLTAKFSLADALMREAAMKPPPPRSLIARVWRWFWPGT